MAHVAERVVYGDKSRETGPRLKSAKLGRDRLTLALGFTGVNGRLAPKTGIQGFSLDCAAGRVPIDGRAVKDASTVVLSFRAPLPEGCTLWHGRGLNPVTNLKDSADLPVPVLGPVAL